MGTRGLLGIKSNGKIDYGRFNSHDSYYNNLGKEVIDYYFNDGGINIIELAGDNYGESNKKDFIYDGLFCEYAYIYNSDNNTLEIYRGFFKEPQFKGHKGFKSEDIEYFCHLVIVIDKNKHTKKQVLKAFEKYDGSDIDCDDKLKEIILKKNGKYELILYPEREIIPFKFEDKYRF